MPEIVREIFENYVKETFDLKDCIAVNNGTSALIAPLWSMDFQDGDEVITTPFTFIATTNAIIIAGAKPVFVDINPNTLLIDVDKIEEAITSKTKAVKTEVDPNPVVNPKVCENRYDFYSRIKLVDGKIKIKLI